MHLNQLMCTLLIFIILVFTSGCINNQYKNMLSSSKYVALEIDIRDTGVLQSGTPLQVPSAVPYPTFFYSTNFSPLPYPADYPPKNESLKMLIGTYHIDDTPDLLSGTLNVTGVYDYPFKYDSNLTILGVDQNGTIQIKFCSETVLLRPSDIWTSPVVSTRTATITRPYYDTSYSYTVNYSTTYTLNYLSLCDK
jgi:hypothetical protein